MLMYLQAIDSAQKRSKFEEVYRLYRDYMYRVAFAILRNPQDAEDAVQSSFVRVAENIGRIGDARSLGTRSFLVTIVRNIAIDLYRRKRRFLQGEYVDAVVGVENTYRGENGVAKCMLKLPEKQRNVLVLKYCHGYELKEVAKMLGISYQNALKTEQRAKEKLRALCQEEGIEC